MARVYDTGPERVFWAASDVGWVVGHSHICYAPLLVGATTILYEGKPVRTPDAGAFGGSLREPPRGENLFAAPTAFRALRKEDPDAALRPKVRSLGALNARSARWGALRSSYSRSGSRIGSGFLWWITGGRRKRAARSARCLPSPPGRRR